MGWMYITSDQRMSDQSQPPASAKTTWLISMGLACMLGLAGCDKVVNTAAESVSESDAKQHFIKSCTEEGVKASQGLINAEQMNRVCECSYTNAKAKYNDDTEWKKALIEFGIKQDDPVLVQRLEEAMQTCAVELTK